MYQSDMATTACCLVSKCCACFLCCITGIVLACAVTESCHGQLWRQKTWMLKVAGAPKSASYGSLCCLRMVKAQQIPTTVMLTPQLNASLTSCQDACSRELLL